MAANRPTRYSLSTRTLALMRERPSGKADHHFFSIVLSMVNADFPREDAWCYLVAEECLGAVALSRRLKRNRANAVRWFNRQWTRAEAVVRDNPAVKDPFEVQALLSRASEWADANPRMWSGRSGPFRRLAFDSVVHFARQAKSPCVRVSGRQMAEFGVTRQATAAKALRYLVDECPIIKLLDGERSPRGFLYQVVDPAKVRKRVSRPTSVGLAATTDTAMHPVHEAFSPIGLGPTAGRIQRLLAEMPEARAMGGGPVSRRDGGRKPPVARADMATLSHLKGLCRGSGECACRHLVLCGLAEGGLSVAEIASALGVHVTTVRRNVRKLAEFGLVAAHPDSGLLYRVGGDLDGVAWTLGVSGNADRRRARHEAARLAFYKNWTSRFTDEDGVEWFVNPATGERLIPLSDLSPTVDRDRWAVGGA